MKKINKAEREVINPEKEREQKEKDIALGKNQKPLIGRKIAPLPSAIWIKF